MSLAYLAKKRIDDLIARYMETLSDGEVKTMEDYRLMAGKIAGLREAWREIEPLIKDDEEE